jgi:hypothetical protein
LNHLVIGLSVDCTGIAASEFSLGLIVDFFSVLSKK